MRNLISLLVVAALLFMVPPAKAAVTPQSRACKYAAYHPGFAIACFWEIYFEMGGGYDWD